MFLLLCLYTGQIYSLMMKNRIGIFIVGCLAYCLSSCLGGDDGDYVVEKNCQIATFTLQHDSISGLSSVKFTIDQLTGSIFNADSLPYGTEIEKLVCTITYMNSYSVLANTVMQEAVGDTIVSWNGTDSLDFSKPVKFLITAYDGVTTKSYKAQVNVHQVVPDSMVWSLFSDRITDIPLKEQKVITYAYGGVESYLMYVRPTDNSAYRLYQAPVSDARNWKEISLSGLPASGVPLTQVTAYNGLLYLPSVSGVLYQSTDGQVWTVATGDLKVRYLLGAVKEGQGQPSSLSAIVDKDGTLTFASMNKEKVWSTGDAVPAYFPVTGFGNTDYYTMYHEYLMIAGGRDKDNQLLNSTWATMNGLLWAKLTDDESVDSFSKREGAMLTKYDDKYFLIGGLAEDGSGLKDIYTSIDYGVTWSLQDSLVVLPDTYAARGFSSVQVDKDQYMLIFAGKTGQNTNELNEVWRGRINRLGFDK